MAAPPVSNGPISHSPRSQHDRTRREDRHFKFYARWDNLHPKEALVWPTQRGAQRSTRSISSKASSGTSIPTS